MEISIDGNINSENVMEILRALEPCSIFFPVFKFQI